MELLTAVFSLYLHSDIAIVKHSCAWTCISQMFCTWFSALSCWLGDKVIRPVTKSEWCGADWSKVQTCIWPSWCHCHSLSPASVKSRLVLPFCYRLTRLVLDKGQLNVCVCFVFDSAADVHDCSHTYSIVLRILLFWGWHSSFELQKK